MCLVMFPLNLVAIATITKLAGYEFTKYVTYSDEGKIIALSWAEC